MVDRQGKHAAADDDRSKHCVVANLGIVNFAKMNCDVIAILHVKKV
jgi:hypothetical protein